MTTRHEYRCEVEGCSIGDCPNCEAVRDLQARVQILEGAVRMYAESKEAEDLSRRAREEKVFAAHRVLMALARQLA